MGARGPKPFLPPKQPLRPACRVCHESLPYIGKGRPPVTCKKRECRNENRREVESMRQRPGAFVISGASTEKETDAQRRARLAAEDRAEMLAAEREAAEGFEDYLADLNDLPVWMPVNARGFMSRAAFLAAYYEEFGEDDAPRPQDLYAALVNDGLFAHTKLRGVRGFRAIPDDEDTE